MVVCGRTDMVVRRRKPRPRECRLPLERQASRPLAVGHECLVAWRDVAARMEPTVGAEALGRRRSARHAGAR